LEDGPQAGRGIELATGAKWSLYLPLRTYWPKVLPPSLLDGSGMPWRIERVAVGLIDERQCLLLAQMRRTNSASAGPVLGPYRTFVCPPATSQIDPEEKWCSFRQTDVRRSVSAYFTVEVQANIPGQIVGHVEPRQFLWVKYVVRRDESLGLVQGADVKFEDVTPFGNFALAFPGEGRSARVAESSAHAG
jgi:hypothetical protein